MDDEESVLKLAGEYASIGLDDNDTPGSDAVLFGLDDFKEFCKQYENAIKAEVIDWHSFANDKPPISDFRPADPTKPHKVTKEVIVATKEGRVFTTIFTSLGFANINSRTDEVMYWKPMPDHPTKDNKCTTHPNTTISAP